jgi:hypothetical protein
LIHLKELQDLTRKVFLIPEQDQISQQASSLVPNVNDNSMVQSGKMPVDINNSWPIPEMKVNIRTCLLENFSQSATQL